MRATRAIVDLARLSANIAALVAFCGPHTKLCIPVKANAYGHGAVAVARAAVAAGAAALGVGTTDEAAELRAAGVRAPLLHLGLPIAEEFSALLELDAETMLADLQLATELSAVAVRLHRTVRVHLKVDTGMGRIGCEPEAAAELAVALCQLSGLRLVGIATHFARADEPDLSFSQQQLDRFLGAAADVELAIGRPLLRHAANSVALLRIPESRLDMARPGIAAYGHLRPQHVPSGLDLAPALTFKTRVVQTKRVPAGIGLSYGHTYVTERETRIATLPVGYADGYPRALSGAAEVAIDGRRFPVVGNICMDQCLVELGPKSDVQSGDEVILLGIGPGAPSAAEVAGWLGTIAYEVLAGISARVPRVYEDWAG
jgi:alanine racemase